MCWVVGHCFGILPTPVLIFDKIGLGKLSWGYVDLAIPLTPLLLRVFVVSDPKRPSSASRATPERRGMAEKPGLVSPTAFAREFSEILWSEMEWRCALRDVSWRILWRKLHWEMSCFAHCKEKMENFFTIYQDSLLSVVKFWDVATELLLMLNCNQCMQLKEKMSYLKK